MTEGFFAHLGYGNFLLVFTVLVFVHELGHYLAARWCRVAVSVFSIGFGPELLGWTDRRGTRWRFSLIPLGGYIRMLGDAPEEGDGESKEDAPDNFSTKPLWIRAVVVGAGPAANFIFAMAAFALLFMTLGQPKPVDFAESGIGAVAPGSAADLAGFRAGDRILSVDGASIADFPALGAAVRNSDGRPMRFEVERAGRPMMIVAAPRPVSVEGGPAVHRLGVHAPPPAFVRLGPTEALWLGVSRTGELTASIIGGLWDLLSGRARLDDLAGPVRIAQMSSDAGALGVGVLVGWMALLSINLGIVNLLPIPALDGGHLVLFAAEAVTRRPVSPRLRMRFAQAGVLFVLALTIFVTINDFQRL